MVQQNKIFQNMNYNWLTEGLTKNVKQGLSPCKILFLKFYFKLLFFNFGEKMFFCGILGPEIILKIG